MASIARFVVPGLPHHVTQRGNRRENVFFCREIGATNLSTARRGLLQS
jgi:REP element-mobilizing transposase RayT